MVLKDDRLSLVVLRKIMFMKKEKIYIFNILYILSIAPARAWISILIFQPFIPPDNRPRAGVDFNLSGAGIKLSADLESPPRGRGFQPEQAMASMLPTWIAPARAWISILGYLPRMLLQLIAPARAWISILLADSLQFVNKSPPRGRGFQPSMADLANETINRPRAGVDFNSGHMKLLYRLQNRPPAGVDFK